MTVDWWEVWDKYWYQYLGSLGMFGRIIEITATKLPDKIVAISNYAVRRLLKLGVKRERIQIIHNGVNFYKIQKVKPHEDKSDVIYLGRLKNHKNVHILIESIKILRNYFPDISLHIIGGGPEKDRLLKLTENLGIKKNVKFLGEIENEEEIIARLKSAKVFVHPSTREGGSSITLFEANACGLPFIAIRRENNIDTELIQDGENGYFIEDLSASLIAQKVKEILNCPELLYNLKKRSIKYAKRYDWSKITDKYESLFYTLVNKNVK